MSLSDHLCKIPIGNYILFTLCTGGANKDANIELIRQALNESNWQRVFINTNVNEQVEIFNSTTLNVLINFIPHEFVVCDDKEHGS